MTPARIYPLTLPFLFRSRPRLISAVLALVSIGLFASLLPQTSFVSQSSGHFVDAIGPVWPDQSVEQDLGHVEAISEVRIWARARFDRGEAPIVASLFQGQAEEPVRQLRFNIAPSNVLVSHILVFPPHNVAPGEKLSLQLWVSPRRENSLFFGTSERGTGPPAVVNRQPTGRGPLAYEVIWRGTGWQAALEGSRTDLARLAGALAAAALAAAITVLLHPFVRRTLRNGSGRRRAAFETLAGPFRRTLQRTRVSERTPRQHTEAPATLRSLYVFPWLIPAFAILHYLSNNLLLFRVSESIAVFVVTMAVVTVSFVAFRIIFKRAAVAAMITGLLGIAFFSYGHIYLTLGQHADDRYLLGIGLPIVLGLVMLVTRRPEPARKIGTILNFASLALVAVSTYPIVYFSLSSASSLESSELSQEFAGLDERVAEAKAQFSGDELPDIYYIILDEYPRNGSPPEFDNSEFVQELESRGFYVASQARSNYLESFFSIPSSLNVQYVGEDHKRDEQESQQLVEMGDNHALGQILKLLEYKYIHISSGYIVSNTSRNADLLVDFAPAGRLLSRPEIGNPFSNEEATRLSSRFTNTFLRTTAAKPFLSHEFNTDHDGPYEWTHPFRTLAWLDFMKDVAGINGPKFVFAHLLKPHDPHSFDKHGNITFDFQGWPDDHDPTVPGAFYAQLIWLNGQILEVIDAILDDYDEPPIIVIAGDHGHERHNPAISNDILTAFLLPDGGESALYPSITSVNTFRVILDYYFGFNLGLLEDRVYHLGG